MMRTNAFPPEAVAKFERLRDGHEIMAGAIMAAVDVQAAAREEVLAAQRDLGNAEHRHGFRVAQLSPDERFRREAPLSAAKDRLKKAAARVELAVAQRDVQHGFWPALEEFWRETGGPLSGKKYRYVGLPPVRLIDPHKQLEAVRRKLDSALAERETVDHAPATRVELLDRFDRELDRFAGLGKPSLARTSRQGDPIGIFGKLHHAVPEGSEGYASMAPAAANAFFVWLLRDEIRARVIGLLGDRDAPNALPTDQREHKLKELAAQVLALEREEEAVISAAEVAGTVIVHRRRDASPLAILEIEELPR